MVVTHRQTLRTGPFQVIDHILDTFVVADQILRTSEHEDLYTSFEDRRNIFDSSKGRVQSQLSGDLAIAFNPSS